MHVLVTFQLLQLVVMKPCAVPCLGYPTLCKAGGGSPAFMLIICEVVWRGAVGAARQGPSTRRKERRENSFGIFHEFIQLLRADPAACGEQ